MKPVCVPCERFMRPKKNGYHFLEGMPVIENHGTGKGAEGWAPYKLWMGDLWECPTCKTQIVSGVARQPISEHYLADFSRQLNLYGNQVGGAHKLLLVKDC